MNESRASSSSDQDWRGAVACVIAALVAVAIGQRVPLPGLDLGVLGGQAAQSDALWARVSIMALGIWPLFTALAFAEIARLVHHAFAKRRAAPTGRRRWAPVLVGCLALGLTAMQGIGIVFALETSGLVDPEASAFRLTGLACFLGVTALFVWLTDRSRPFGLWWLIAVPYLVGAPSEIRACFDLVWTGAATLADGLAHAIYVVGATALTILAFAALVRLPRPEGVRHDGPVAILLWPAFLAGITGGIVGAPLFALMPGLAESAEALTAVRFLSVVVLVPMFVWLYARFYGLAGVGTAAAGAFAPVLLLVAAVQVIVVVVGDLLLRFSPLPFSPIGAPLLALVTMLLVLGRSSGLLDFLLRQSSPSKASVAS